MPSRRSSVTTLTLAAIATFMSCKTSGPSASSTIGTAGGTVTSSDGLATLTISPGALSADTAITIAPTTGVPSGALGTAYEISPTGTLFIKPAGLVITLGATTGTGRLAIGTVTSGQWSPLAMSSISSDGKSVAALLTHLSPYGAMAIPPCTKQANCEMPFQCVGNECSIPCRNATDCPPPMGCSAKNVCSMTTCSVPADCAGTADVPSLNFSAICDLFTHLCIDFDSAQMPGQACQIEPLAGGMPPVGVCPGAQDEVCGSCAIKSCTYADALGVQQPNCSTVEVCAYGSCWPTSDMGCLCGSAGCSSCTSSTGGAGTNGSSGGTSGSGGGGQSGGGGASGGSSGPAGASGTSGAGGTSTGGSSAGGAGGGGSGGKGGGGGGGAGGMTCQGQGYVPCSSNADCSATAAAPSEGCGTCDPPGWTGPFSPNVGQCVAVPSCGSGVFGCSCDNC